MTPKAPLVFAPVIRWVVAWPDGSTLRLYDDRNRDIGPELFEQRGYAYHAAHERFNVPEGGKPVKVRVTIEETP